MNRLLYFCFATILIFLGNVHSLNLKEERRNHRHAILTNEQIIKLSKLTDLSNINDVLDNILIPRIVGTEGHRNVRKYIVKQLEDLDWDVERDLFEEVVPILGKLEFENIVARLNPHAKRYLTLACHYDSKYIPGHIFLGATDSAVPCAMMLNIIKVMKPMLDQIKHKTDVSLKLIFFDGEEAFERWGPKDSIYGSKHLAKKWHRTYYPKNNRDQTTELDRMDMMILLDLLGAPDPIFSSYFRSTEKWYMRLVNIEERLSGMRLLERYSTGDPEQVYFRPYSVSSYIEDDHIPFLKRDVPILHVIPNPFPEVWHTPGDNRDVVDINTVENLNKIFRIFVAEYLHLSV